MGLPLTSLKTTPGIVMLMLFHVCLATCSVASNVLLLVALLNARHLLRKNNYIYTFSITLSDLVVSSAWFYYVFYKSNSRSNPFNNTVNLVLVVHGISLITILAAMIDRYLAVQHPFKYTQRMTRTKVLFVVVFIWVWPLAATIAKSYSQNASASLGYSIIVFSIVMFGVMSIVNVKLYIVTKRQQRREPQGKGASKQRYAWLIIIASTVFLILWTPSMIHSGTCYTFEICMPFYSVAADPLSVFRAMNTLITPLIFLLGSPLTRSSLKDLLHKRTRQDAGAVESACIF
ncbi:melanocortin receptor 3-like [Lethenteron reissneri]|uniref:melanocortin receptor 3-like n=1 Tax=Lethenteron reissneri TaxID=7753 RepID=UPI002AB6252B|nr:melanocortin receptor 3-like [Lethenteron reissneri]